MPSSRQDLVPIEWYAVLVHLGERDDNMGIWTSQIRACNRRESYRSNATDMLYKLARIAEHILNIDEELTETIYITDFLSQNHAKIYLHETSSKSTSTASRPLRAQRAIR